MVYGKPLPVLRTLMAEYGVRGLPESDNSEATWIAENHHRHRLSQLQEDFRHIIDNNTPVEKIPDNQGQVGQVCGQLLSPGGFPFALRANLSMSSARPDAPVYPKSVGAPPQVP